MYVHISIVNIIPTCEARVAQMKILPPFAGMRSECNVHPCGTCIIVCEMWETKPIKFLSDIDRSWANHCLFVSPDEMHYRGVGSLPFWAAQQGSTLVISYVC